MEKIIEGYSAKILSAILQKRMASLQVELIKVKQRFEKEANELIRESNLEEADTEEISKDLFEDEDDFEMLLWSDIENEADEFNASGAIDEFENCGENLSEEMYEDEKYVQEERQKLENAIRKKRKQYIEIWTELDMKQMRYYTLIESIQQIVQMLEFVQDNTIQFVIKQHPPKTAKVLERGDDSFYIETCENTVYVYVKTDLKVV